MSPFSDPSFLVNEYGQTYWSGNNTALKIGDVWLEEGTQLHFQVVETAQPLYHYSEYTARVIPHGTRIITGELTLNLTQFSYIFGLLSEINGLSPKEEDSLQIVDRPTIDFSSISSQNMTDSNQIAKYVESVNKQRLETVKRLASSKPTVNSNAPIFATDIEFDLDILLGVDYDSSKVLTMDTEGSWKKRGKVFNPIDGAPGSSRSSPFKRPGTGLRLKKVHLYSSGYNLDDSGRNFMETFQFLAKDIQFIN